MRWPNIVDLPLPEGPMKTKFTCGSSLAKFWGACQDTVSSLMGHATADGKSLCISFSWFAALDGPKMVKHVSCHVSLGHASARLIIDFC